MRKSLIVISGPSGAGKTTIIKRILSDPELKDKIMFSVSHTTRKKRKGEKEGEDYFFVSEKEFREMIEKGEFLEWAEVHGNLYGTHKNNIEKAEEENKILLLDIDVQGAEKIREKMKEKAVFVFIRPSSIEELKKRLISRGDTPEKEIEKRIKDAQKEIEEEKKFDFVIINDNLEHAVNELKEIAKKVISENQK